MNKSLLMELARCEYIQRRENVIAVGNSGTGKTHIALGLGLAACQRGMSVGFTTAAALVHELMEARDERRLLNLPRQMSRLGLLIIDELGFVPLSPPTCPSTGLRERLSWTHPPRPHPGDERRQLPPQAQPRAPPTRSRTSRKTPDSIRTCGPLLLTSPRPAPNSVLSHRAGGTRFLRRSGTPSRRP